MSEVILRNGWYKAATPIIFFSIVAFLAELMMYGVQRPWMLIGVPGSEFVVGLVLILIGTWRARHSRR